MRSKVQRELMLKEKERKEQELQSLVQRARSERTGIPHASAAATPPASDRTVVDDDDLGGTDHHERPSKESEEREERLQSEKLREERRHERERERRLEVKDGAMGKKSKLTRDRDHDISEKVALGMANTGAGRGEVMYDSRLFNQEKGMASGFATDDQYNIYDKGVFTAQNTLSTLYRPKGDADSEVYGGEDEQLENVLSTKRFKADKQFTGASERTASIKRAGSVEFVKQQENDPFGLDQFLTEVKKGKKVMDKIRSGGTMKASGGSPMRDDYERGGSGRTRIAFVRRR